MTTVSVESKRSVLGRVFEVLDCFDRADPEQSVSAVCRRTGLPPATVHRLLASLVEWGAVERTSRGCYRLGVHLWSLGHRVPEVRQLRDVARPHLVDLYAALHLPVVLVGREKDRAILMDSITGRAHHDIWTNDRTAPLDHHPAGQVIRAFSSPPEPSDEDRVEDLGLHRTLGEIRRLGFAAGSYPMPSPTQWVAAPVRDIDPGATHSLAVALPGTGAIPQNLPALVTRAAANISGELRSVQRVAREV